MRGSLASRIERELPAEAVALLRRIGKSAAADGEPAFLVGGVVRDLWLGRPAGDLDVVVEGDAIALARRLLRQGAAVRARLHDRFGTGTVWLGTGLRVDLATCRHERYAAPGALPEVAASSLRADLARRDFTINALAAHLTPSTFGRVVDPFGGRRDLEGGLIRSLHGRSFHDDPTRAFRAARLAARLSFRIERQTARWIREAVRDRVLGRLSAARLRREMERVFEEEAAARAVGLLARLGVLAAVHPRLEAGRARLAALRRARRLEARVRASMPGIPILGWVLGLVVLSARLSAGERREIVERLRPNRSAALVILEGPEKARALEKRLGRSERRRPSAVHAACRGHPTEVLLLAAATSARERVGQAVALYLERLRDVRPDITGADLLRAGIAPGPRIATGLEAALASKLDGRAQGRDEQLLAALAAIRTWRESRRP